MKDFKNSSPHGPKAYRFKVDGQQFESMNQMITGLELRQLAGLTADIELYVDVPHGWVQALMLEVAHRQAGDTLLI